MPNLKFKLQIDSSTTYYPLQKVDGELAKESNKFQVMISFSINVSTNQFYHQFQLRTSVQCLDYSAQGFLGLKKVKKRLLYDFRGLLFLTTKCSSFFSL